MAGFYVHDLVRIAAADRVRGEATPPPWVEAALATAPWGVVRRVAARPPQIAVGVRGAVRGERWAGWIDEDDVVERLTPEDLTDRLAHLSPRRLAASPALAAAAALDARWRSEAAGAAWGPTGGVGFELASGRPTVSPTSDLDAIVRCPQPIALAQAQAWIATFEAAATPVGARCDVLLETPCGAVALLDYARAAPSVILRTEAGPRLVQDPWAELSVSS